jgi:thioredoxin reductase (NADPH)
LIIATGVTYRRPPLTHLSRFEGSGIYYAATFMEAQLCSGEDVVVVGGGNSAGQAALYLSTIGRHVYMLVRSEGLSASIWSMCDGAIARPDGPTLMPSVTSS